jgi:hypothetical protein
VTYAPFEGLGRRIQRWVDYEQIVNERLIDDRHFSPIDHRSNTVRAELRPERRPVWDQPVVWLSKASVRAYGPLDDDLRAAFGVGLRADRAPMLLHPQAPAALRRLAPAGECEVLAGVAATPTASFRSLVAWQRRGQSDAVVLKLSLGAVVGRKRRRFTELYVAQGIVLSSVLATIPVVDRTRLKLDWFTESSGVVDVRSRHGWLLRRLPESLTGPGTTTLMPVFSLISQHDDCEPLLVRLARRSARAPEDFAIDTLIRPYVNAEAYLLFEQGIQHEGHAQNVLVEVDAHQRLTGRLVLRDLTDTSVNIAFRMAKEKALPRFLPGQLPSGAPFSIAGNAGDHHTNFRRSRIRRGFDTVERYGLWGFVWPINTSMARFFDGYDANRVERRYLELWQQAAIDYLKVRPLFRARPKGLATDEAVAYFLRQIDWRASARGRHVYLTPRSRSWGKVACGGVLVARTSGCRAPAAICSFRTDYPRFSGRRFDPLQVHTSHAADDLAGFDARQILERGLLAACGRFLCALAGFHGFYGHL